MAVIPGLNEKDKEIERTRTSGSLTRRPFLTIGVMERNRLLGTQTEDYEELFIVIGTKFFMHGSGSSSSTDSPDSE